MARHFPITVALRGLQNSFSWNEICTSDVDRPRHVILQVVVPTLRWANHCSILRLPYVKLTWGPPVNLSYLHLFGVPLYQESWNVIYHVPSCLFVFFFLYYVFLHRASPFRFLLVPSLVLPPPYIHKQHLSRKIFYSCKLRCWNNYGTIILKP